MRAPTRSHRAGRRVLGALAALACVGLVVPAPAADPARPPAGWPLLASSLRAGADADQGVATVLTDGAATVVQRGSGDVPRALRDAGWDHVGDPGSVGGLVIEPYQRSSDPRAKLFRVTTPDGRQVLLRHQLLPGEQSNNSFAAPAPTGGWFLAGGWGTRERLLAFRLPPLHGGTRTLPLAGTVTLDRRVRAVQGCAFATATRLLCSTDDRGRDLFPTLRQVLELRLRRAADGRPVAATVRYLGQAPVAGATAAGEVEGIDVSGAVVRLTAKDGGSSRLYSYLRGCSS